MSYYSEKLQQVLSDPLQRKAYETEDSTVVIAGPGSGKTTILTLKILKLLSKWKRNLESFIINIVSIMMEN